MTVATCALPGLAQPLRLTMRSFDAQEQRRRLVTPPRAASEQPVLVNVTDLAPRSLRVLFNAGWHLGPTTFLGGGLGVAFGGRL